MIIWCDDNDTKDTIWKDVDEEILTCTLNYEFKKKKSPLCIEIINFDVHILI
jgi:hypothetical protein